jgi:hypothetical protein
MGPVKQRSPQRHLRGAELLRNPRRVAQSLAARRKND